MHKKRNLRRRRQRDRYLRTLFYAVPLVLVILTAVGIAAVVTKSSGSKTAKKEAAQSVPPLKTESESKDLKPDEDQQTPKEPEQEPTDTAEPKETEKPFTLADLNNPEGFDIRPTENGIVLQNQQIDLNGLDTTCLDWGQGGDLDQWNRPAGCMQYQEKYGKYNAYFISDEPEKKVIYLTLDEGYEYGCSSRILDTLKEKNVHAVFFITKSYAEQNPDLVRRMIEEGHEVGNHSVTHPADGLPSQDIERQTSEVTGNHDYVKQNFNYDMHLFRYPAGKFSEQSVALLNNLNYKSVFWSFAYLDYDVENQPDPAESLQKIMSKLHPGAIYLLHAESETNTQILGDFIDQVRAQGYEFKVFE
ncbi:MAG: polysaccharide deacetylase family protein [Lachnospiraceae bacterium]|nr:polysaccharide deacetylase family protein [Lachnospiraceae bacterium]